MNLKLLKRKGMGRWMLGIGGAILLVFLLTGSDGLINVYRLHRQLSDAKTRIRLLNGSIDSLHHEIRRLQSDTLYIERMARERLGMARPDERVYKFSDVKE